MLSGGSARALLFVVQAFVPLRNQAIENRSICAGKLSSVFTLWCFGSSGVGSDGRWEWMAMKNDYRRGTETVFGLVDDKCGAFVMNGTMVECKEKKSELDERNGTMIAADDTMTGT